MGFNSGFKGLKCLEESGRDLIQILFPKFAWRGWEEP